MKFQFEFPSVRSLFSVAIAASLPFVAFEATSSRGLAQQPTKAIPGDTSTFPNGFELKQDNGPWLVHAMSFDGYNAKKQAEQLATELRRDFKLQAYCLAKKFDFTQPLTGAGIDKEGNTRRMKVRDRKVVEGYAVLVGDFDSIDSPAITDALETIKRISPKALATTNADLQNANKSSSVSVNDYRKFLSFKKSKGAEQKGPMYIAFTTRNPLLPEEYYKAPELDKFVQKLNQRKEYSEFSLLDCPGKFTVRVAVFSGQDTFESWGRASSSSDQNDKDKVSQLDLAAERAALSAKALRRINIEAYQFHDQTQSYVTVGSFDSLGSADQANRFTYDPGIVAIMKQYGATSQLTRSNYGLTPTPRLLIDLVGQRNIPELNQGDEKSKLKWFTKYSVAFDIKPAPMAVPKATGSKIYGGSLLGIDRR